MTESRFLRRANLIAPLLLVQSVAAQVASNPPAIPKPLQPPKDQVLLFHLQGKGKQIYVCESAGGVYAWKFKVPEANLYDDRGKLVGRHFEGPTWEAKDRSRAVGQVVASFTSPDPNAIPWLLLTSVFRDYKGVFSKVLSIQRLNTKGGVAPTKGCRAGKARSENGVPYEAAYYFYGAR